MYIVEKNSHIGIASSFQYAIISSTLYGHTDIYIHICMYVYILE